MIAIYPQNYKNNRSFVRKSSQFISMLYYLKNYPLTLTIVAVICYLSFFTPDFGVRVGYIPRSAQKTTKGCTCGTALRCLFGLAEVDTPLSHQN